jgi:hypothetical protein
MGRRRTVAQRLVPALVKTEVTQAKGSEDELARHADVIHRSGAIGLKEGAMRLVVFPEHDLLPSAGSEGGVFLPLPRFFNRSPISHLHPNIGMLKEAPKQISLKVRV